MKTKKTLAIRELGYFRETAFYNNIRDYKEEDKGDNIIFTFTRWRGNKLYSYNLTVNKNKLLFYGLREQIHD